MTAGVAAAEMTMSASAKLTYGNFGTGDYRSGYTAPNAGGFAVNATTGAIAGTAGTYTTGGAGAAGTSNIAALSAADLTKGETAYDAAEAVKAGTGAAAGLAAAMKSHALRQAAPDSAWTSEADLDIAGSGGGGNVTYSATLELDESSAHARFCRACFSARHRHVPCLSTDVDPRIFNRTRASDTPFIKSNRAITRTNAAIGRQSRSRLRRRLFCIGRLDGRRLSCRVVQGAAAGRRSLRLWWRRIAVEFAQGH